MRWHSAATGLKTSLLSGKPRNRSCEALRTPIQFLANERLVQTRIRRGSEGHPRPLQDSRLDPRPRRSAGPHPGLYRRSHSPGFLLAAVDAGQESRDPRRQRFRRVAGHRRPADGARELSPQPFRRGERHADGDRRRQPRPSLEPSARSPYDPLLDGHSVARLGGGDRHARDRFLEGPRLYGRGPRGRRRLRRSGCGRGPKRAHIHHREAEDRRARRRQQDRRGGRLAPRGRQALRDSGAEPRGDLAGGRSLRSAMGRGIRNHPTAVLLARRQARELSSLPIRRGPHLPGPPEPREPLHRREPCRDRASHGRPRRAGAGRPLLARRAHILRAPRPRRALRAVVRPRESLLRGRPGPPVHYRPDRRSGHPQRAPLRGGAQEGRRGLRSRRSRPRDIRESGPGRRAAPDSDAGERTPLAGHLGGLSRRERPFPARRRGGRPARDRAPGLPHTSRIWASSGGSSSRARAWWSTTCPAIPNR